MNYILVSDYIYINIFVVVTKSIISFSDYFSKMVQFNHWNFCSDDAGDGLVDTILKCDYLELQMAVKESVERIHWGVKMQEDGTWIIKGVVEYYLPVMNQTDVQNDFPGFTVSAINKLDLHSAINMVNRNMIFTVTAMKEDEGLVFTVYTINQNRQ